MHILQATSEFYPYSKTGGLADMVAGLSGELASQGHKITVVTPLYKETRFLVGKSIGKGFPFELDLGKASVNGRFIPLQTESGINIYFVEHEGFFDRNGVYMENGEGYPDNPDRYIFFSKAVCQLTEFLAAKPDILHCHDWQTAFVPLLNEGRIPNCLTIHNLAYQGECELSKFKLTNLPEKYLTSQYAEYFGKLNPLKAGIVSADVLTTVSPGYAREIVTKEFGEGLEGELQSRGDCLRGVLNGVDYSQWRTENNPNLSHGYNANNLEGKGANKRELLDYLNMPNSYEVPLFCYIGRIAEQKGLHLLLDTIKHWLPFVDARFVLLGTGDGNLESQFKLLSTQMPNKVRVLIEYNEKLAHRIKAAADFFLMPSKYEPCGLNQIYSLRYGTIPIVHNVGGLGDTVKSINTDCNAGNGFIFNEHTITDFTNGIKEAFKFYRFKNDLNNARKRGMNEDFGWESSARQYTDLYNQIKQTLPA